MYEYCDCDQCKEEMLQIGKMLTGANSRIDTNAQPAPKKNTDPFVKDLVLKDMADRAEFGKAKYGMYLQPNNGRDTLVDTYQELLDAVIYIRSLIYERDRK